MIDMITKLLTYCTSGIVTLTIPISKAWVRQNTTVFVPVLLGLRHVSATVGHPQVTKIYIEEKLYSVRSLVLVNIVNFQRNLVVMRFVHIELITVAYPGILFGGGGSTNSFEDRGQRERGYGGGSPLVRSSGGSCNLVQEISFLVFKLSPCSKCNLFPFG